MLALVSIVATGCSAGPASEPTDQAESSTVTLENVLPTLTEDEEDGETVLVEDPSVARGSVDVPYQPERVVPFDIGTLDTLDAIGAGDSVIAIPEIQLPDYLSDYDSLPRVGTLFEPDYEAVAELSPDLIVTAGRSTGAYNDLAEIATTIDLRPMVDGVMSPAAAFERAAQLGEVFGLEDEVQDLVVPMEERITSIRELSAEAGSMLMLLVSGGEYGALGKGSTFGYLYDELGFEPAVPADELPGAVGSPHGEVVSNEFILDVDPSWIFVFDRGMAIGRTEGGTAEETLDNELVAQTQAARDGHIVYLPPTEFYIVMGGLTALDTVTETVLDALSQ